MTPKTDLHRTFTGAILALVLVAAACGSSSAPASPAPSNGAGATSPPPATEPTPVPGTTADPGAGQGGGGGQTGNPGSGVQPGDPGGGPVPVDPGNPEPTIVTPVAGATGVRPVPAANLEASVSGRNVAVRIAWWSGVEPCYVLAGIDVVRDGNTITLTVNEGAGAGPDIACIEIAIYKATIVDLGELEPGTWAIRAHGEAAPIEVTIAG